MNVGVVVLVLIGVLFTLIKWGLIILGIVWLARHLRRTQEEKQRFRLELGKLAEEVQLLRRELKDSKNAGSPAQAS
jgi:branched-subunit amino acid aminotransferase/4-amino-4-deoxychorismate lyase